MVTENLQDYYTNDCPFFDYYKIYSDGSHYIARKAIRGRSVKREIKFRTEMDEVFEALFATAREAYDTEGKTGKDLKELKAFIQTGMEDSFPDESDLEKYVSENVDRKIRNIWKREKRFRRKAYLNRWNYFVTFTYSDLKHTEDSFRKKLRKCLSNLHTRRGWCFQGVAEHGKETGRLHYHFLVYVPEGEMIGEIFERKEYSKREGKMKITHPNDFFERKFGKSDFEELSEMEIRNGNAINYLLKYLRKTDERVIYSRGTPMEICKRLDENAFVAEIENDYVQKFVVFDNVISWERDIKPRTQRRLRYVA